jgi:hypothetical protein
MSSKPDTPAEAPKSTHKDNPLHLTNADEEARIEKVLNNNLLHGKKGPDLLRDAILVMLDVMKEYPNALHDFYDQKVNSFKFQRGPKPDSNFPAQSWVIYRIKDEVLVSRRHRRRSIYANC